MRSLQQTLWAAADLALGFSCPGCAAPAAGLCPACTLVLLGADPLEPAPDARIGVPVHAAGRYRGVLRAAILQHKEHGRLGLSDPLARLLAGAVAYGLEKAAGGSIRGELLLLPVPSTPSARRRRGFDHTGRLAERCAAVLSTTGTPARAASALGHRRRVRDQSDLSRAARWQNVSGAFCCQPLPASPPSGCPWVVVVVDDVSTSGATLSEAVRAVHDSGSGVAFAATVALV